MVSSSFTSFGDSLLHDLSSQSWRRGIINFFSESIPFSFSSSHEYADLVSSYIDCFSRCLNEPLEIVEWGAGNGVFAKKCIQSLSEKKCLFNYLVTEYSSTLVDGLNSMDDLRELDHVKAQVLDIHDFSLETPFHVGILTYLLDTFPVNILELREGRLYEWRVCVSVKEEAVLQWMQDGELITWDKAAIEMWLSKPITDDTLALLSRIHDCLMVRWESRECLASDLDSTGILESWLSKQSNHDQGFFNFSSSWWRLLDSLRHQANDSFMVFIYDFASTHPSQFKTCEESYGRFGVCYFYSVPFFLFQAYCDHHHLQFYSSQFPDSDNQMAVITSIKNPSFEKHVMAIFQQEEPGNRVYDYTLKIQQSESMDRCLDLIKEVENELSVSQKLDYVLLFSIASKLYQFDCYDRSITYIDTMLDDYGYFSLNAVLLKSKVLRKQLQFDLAVAVIERGIDQVPLYDLLHLENVFIAHALNQNDRLKESLMLYLKTALVNPQWHLLDLLKAL